MSRPLREKAGSDARFLTSEQESELVGGFAWLQAVPDPSSTVPVFFETDDARREAWLLHGERIMKAWQTPSRRPLAWWLYEAGEPRPETARDEQIRLLVLGHLTGAEMASLPDLSAEARREIIATPGVFERIPKGMRAAVAKGLFAGLTPFGQSEYLDELSPSVRLAIAL